MSGQWTSRNWGKAARLATVLAGIGMLASLCGCPPEEQQPIRVSINPGNGGRPRTPEEVLELAKAEGALYWYTSLSEGDAEEFLSQFRQKYPFIRTELERGGSFTIAEKVTSETTSGRVQADVLHVLDPTTFVGLRNQAALLYYDSPATRNIPARYKDTGYWAAMRAVTLGMAYDPRRLKKQEAPQRWPDLLHPRFRGKLGIKDAETAGAAYALVFLLRERYGTAFLEGLGTQRPKIYKTVSQMQDALRRGEIAVAAGDVGLSVGEEEAASPELAFVWPGDGVPMMVGPVAIMAAAPHPNCARLFEDFLLSATGQQLVVQQLGDYSLWPNSEPPRGRLPLEELRLILPTAGWTDYADKRDLLRREFSDLVGAEGE